MVNLGFGHFLDQNNKPEETSPPPANSILTKHTRNFHPASSLGAATKPPNINNISQSLDEQQTNGNESADETRQGWKFMNRKKNLLKLGSQSNLIFPEENDLNEKPAINSPTSQSDSQSSSQTNQQKQPTNQQQTRSEAKADGVKPPANQKNSPPPNSPPKHQTNHQPSKPIIPTVQINSTPANEKLLNPLTLYQTYHQNDYKFRSSQASIHFPSNLDDLRLKSPAEPERRSFSSSFGRKYLCCNLFNDNQRQIDFVIVYDVLLYEYGKKYLSSKKDNLSISNQNSQESFSNRSLNSLNRNNEARGKVSKQFGKESKDDSNRSESDDQARSSSQDSEDSQPVKRGRPKRMTREEETNKDLQRLSASNLEIIDELDSKQDEEIGYLKEKIIDTLNQTPAQISTLSRTRPNRNAGKRNNRKTTLVEDLLDVESNEQSDDYNDLITGGANAGKLTENGKRNHCGLNSRQRHLAECCKRFEDNLIDEGLELEHSEAQFVGTNNRAIGFLKIHCPWELLSRYAELMKLKMPMRQIESTSWREIFDENDPYAKGKFTAPYSRDKEYLFEIVDKRTFFSSAQRSQIVEFILKRKSFSANLNDTSVGISKLLHEGAYIAAYPLHEGQLDIKRPKNIDFDYEEEQIQNRMYQNSDGTPNQLLQENWHSPRVLLFKNWASLKCIFRKQPLDEIRNYYGVKVGLYFSFLGFYTSMLVPASLVGICCFLYGLWTMDHDISIKQVCNKQLDHWPMCPLCNVKGCDYWHLSDTCTYFKFSYLFDNPATVFYAIFMSLWSCVYLEMWKRYSSRITFRWDLSSWDTYEETVRPEFLARLTKSEKKKLNLITKMYEPYTPFWKQRLPYTILSSSVVVLLIMVALASVIGVIIYRVSVRAAIAQIDEKYSSIFTSVSAAMINLMFILILNQLYSYVTFYLTELEIPRTQSDFDNSLTLKMYLLQFVNYYSSIFYIAFFKGRFMSHPGEIIDNTKFTSITQEECGTGGCLLELSIQLAIIMIGKQFVGGLIEMGIPWFQKLLKVWRLKKKTTKSTNLLMPQYESDFLLSQWKPQSLFYEYLEMILQFGFLSIFSACFTLGPIFALINNLLEIRLDAKKMITSIRRPVAQRVKSIGIWYRILAIIGKISVLASALIIAFTSEFIPKLYHYSKHGSLNTYLNNSLSYFNASEIVKIGNKEKYYRHFPPHQPHYCLYQGYRHHPLATNKYEATQTNWELLAIKLAFVVIFENVISFTTQVIAYSIPDVPRSLRQKIRQTAHLTSELIFQQEVKRHAKEEGRHLTSDKSAKHNV